MKSKLFGHSFFNKEKNDLISTYGDIPKEEQINDTPQIPITKVYESIQKKYNG